MFGVLFGTQTTLASNGDFIKKIGSPAQFNHLSGVAVDFVGNIYVADTWNHKIKVYEGILNNTSSFITNKISTKTINMLKNKSFYLDLNETKNKNIEYLGNKFVGINRNSSGNIITDITTTQLDIPVNEKHKLEDVIDLVLENKNKIIDSKGIKFFNNDKSIILTMNIDSYNKYSKLVDLIESINNDVVSVNGDKFTKFIDIDKEIIVFYKKY